MVSNVCYFHPYLGKIPILTIFPITFLEKKCNFAELRLFFFGRRVKNLDPSVRWTSKTCGRKCWDKMSKNSVSTAQAWRCSERPFFFGYSSGWWQLKYFYFPPYLGKIPNLTNIFQMGWNHQLVLDVFFRRFFPCTRGKTPSFKPPIWENMSLQVQVLWGSVLGPTEGR